LANWLTPEKCNTAIWSHLSEMRNEVCVVVLLPSCASLAGCVLCHTYHVWFRFSGVSQSANPYPSLRV